MEARMIAPESTTVPSRSKRTVSNRMRRSYRCPTTLLAVAQPSDFRFLVVPHTHWDREWYLPFEQFRLRLGAVVDGVLDTLERDPSFTSFTLDGQAIVLEDYAEVRPENAGRLQALL